MSVTLEGGCRVSDLMEGPASAEGPLRVWRHVGRHVGAQAISLRVVELNGGLSTELINTACDEILYVFAGRGYISRGGIRDRIQPGTGIYLAPGLSVKLDNDGSEPLVLISAQCPEPVEQGNQFQTTTTPGTPAGKVGVVRFDERETVPTRDRWYRVLVNEDVGCTQVTQFIGSIPPGRAPDHQHDYEEVLVILQGQGRMWAGSASTQIETGSCVFLPRGQVHCVENTGSDELRLLGVFYPSGSPGPRNQRES
ncbi:MAG TPA: cupin domain-containing protein [Blastocatellia bacterium]|nr:cupin domain-containing protein [Blastocatellia bacterium]